MTATRGWAMTDMTTGGPGLRGERSVYATMPAISRGLQRRGRIRRQRRHCRFQPTPGSALLAQIERVGEIARIRTYALQRFEVKPTRDEFEDRRRVVARLVDVTALGIRGDDQGRDARAWPEAVAPPRPVRRRDMIPKPTVFVI